MSDNHEARTVVGIGASAGGLAALRAFFSHVPGDTGMSFVVVVHLDPDHQSHLADLLQPTSTMPVQQVQESTPLEADHVYVIAPGHNLSAVDTHLRVTDIEDERRNRAPIDHFFQTLSETHDGRSIGVILSGTGSDGTLGLAAIRDHGGLTLAQEPSEAEYDGMPRTALNAGVVDVSAPIADLVNQLVAYGTSDPFAPDIGDDRRMPDEVREALSKIAAQIRARTGHDIAGYKSSTVLRRIRRRMQLHQLFDFDGYIELLRSSRDEVQLLFDDVLISVTSFFRDPEVFDAIADDVIPALFAGKGPSDDVRVWSAGCSTGEEAYSLAMLLVEHASGLDDPPQIQIFASDPHEGSLQRAREGVYPSAIESDVGTERLRRFFTPENDAYRIRQELREIVVFAPHDLFRDPPFSHMDLIVCRNVLIYLERATQHTVASVFHYALDPGGHLVLGSSESFDRSDLFVTVDKQHCVYRAREEATREPLLPSFVPALGGPRPRVGSQSAAPPAGHGSLHASLVEQFAPPSILVDAENRIVHYSAHAGRYFVHPGGEPTSEVFLLVPDELRLEMRTTVHAARTEGLASVSHPTTVRLDGQDHTIVVRAIPARADDLDGFVLVIFDEFDARSGIEGASASSDGDRAEVVDGLAEELDVTRRRLQRIIEEYETGQEKMRASNEELQSTNEELRSTMEELETSKEELQSMNEELATLNQENRHKVAELGMLSSDLQNLLASTEIATLFLDRRLRIARFTAPVTEIFNIQHADRGRPLSDFTHRLRVADLEDDARRVLDRLTPVEREIESSDGGWFLTRLLPYRSNDDRIEGVVITFIDITRRLEIEHALRASERRLRLSLDASAMGTWTWTPSSESSTADERACAILRIGADRDDFMEELGRRLNRDDRERLRLLLSSPGPSNEQFELQQVDGENVVIELNARASTDDEATIGTIADISTSVRNTRSIARRSERFRLVSRASELLLRGTDPMEFLEQFFDEMADVLGLEIFERYDLDTDDLLRLVSSGGLTPDESGENGIGCDVCADAIARRDISTHNSIDRSDDVVLGRARELGLRGYACAPLVSGNVVFGALAFGTRTPRPIDAELTEVIRSVADYLAVAEGRLRSETELRRMNQNLEETVTERTADLQRRGEQLTVLTAGLVRAEQRERERIAQVLHDDLQQLLYSAQMHLGLVEEADVSSTERDHFHEVALALEETIALTRSLTVDLSPQELDESDFAGTIQWLADQMQDMHGLAVDVRLQRPVTVADKDVRTMLYRTIRELLFNVVKHAAVDHASISVGSNDGWTEVVVADDGCGFSTDVARDGTNTDGRGLIHIRHRVELLGGEMNLTSAPGNGTRIELRCPNTTSGQSATGRIE